MRTHHNIAKFGIFLILLLLTVGGAGCAVWDYLFILPGWYNPPVGCTPPARWSLTMAANPVAGGTATDLTNASPYTAGTVVNIKAVANSGYRFVNWTALAGTFGNATAAETTFTMPTQHITVTANFELIPPPPTYELTMAADPEVGGTAIDVTNASPYEEGAQVSIKAEANYGYRFVNWTASAGSFDDPNDPETTFTMPAQDVTVTANFELIPPPPTYELTMAADPEVGGTAIDVTNASPYEEGAQVSIKAEANYGYRFVNWTAPAGSFDDPNDPETTFIMPGQAVTVTANFAPFAGGSGSEADPYQIANWHHLHNVRNYLNSYFILVNDLDSTIAGYMEWASPTANGGKGWQPIGDVYNQFAGSFNGQGYEIRDLFINRPDEDGVGLFCAVQVGGVIQNVGVVTGSVSGRNYVGGLAGYNYGTVSNNSYSTGNVDGQYYVGGLVGENYDGTVESSYAKGDVTGKYYVGGLVGVNEGNVSNCYATGSVDGQYYVGGLVGQNCYLRTVDSSYAEGNVIGQYYVGGLVGENYDGTVKSSYAKGDVIGQYYVGGLVGANYGDVNNCYATGSVSGSDHVGGLVGENYGDVSNSYATGSVGGEIYVGGLVAVNYGDVSNSYATGSVSGTDYPCVGGLVGMNYGDVSNSYATGSVSSNDHVGGLVGHNEGVVDKSYATGSVSGNDYIGGLVGRNGGTVSNSYATGSVTSSFCEVGGLVGWNDGGEVNNSYATGSVSGHGSVGGLVGKNEGSVSNSYATGSVTGEYDVGGLVGHNEGVVDKSYATGSVSGGYHNVGGLVGVNYGGTVDSSFWDIETSGQETSDGGEGKTTAEMMDIDTFTNANWDIIAVKDPDDRNTDYIWNIVDDNTYPFLSWQPV